MDWRELIQTISIAVIAAGVIGGSNVGPSYDYRKERETMHLSSGESRNNISSTICDIRDELHNK